MIDRIKSSLCLGLLTCSVFCGGMSVEALAQVGVTYSDGTPWSIEAVSDDNQDYMESYCVAARQYQDGTILSFAENRKNEISMAVDFPDTRFAEHGYLQVVLDPGANQLRQYDVQAASKNAVIVRLGEDLAFIEALSRTGFLRAEIEGRNSNFTLSDVQRVQSNLATCLADIAKDVSFVRAEPVADAAAEFENASKISGQESDRIALQALADLQEKERVIDSLSRELAVLRATQQDLIEKEMLLLSRNDQILQLQGEISALKTKNLNLETQVSSSERGEYRHSDEYQKLRDENAALKVKLGMVSDDEAQLSVAQHTAQSLREENERLALAYAEQGRLVEKLSNANSALHSQVQSQPSVSSAVRMRDVPVTAATTTSAAVAAAAGGKVKDVASLVAHLDPRPTHVEREEPRTASVPVKSENYEVTMSDEASLVPLNEAQTHERRLSDRIAMKKSAKDVPVAEEEMTWVEPKEFTDKPSFGKGDDLIVTRELASRDRDVVTTLPVDSSVTAPQGRVYFSPDYSIETILNESGVAKQSTVHFVEAASNANSLAYQWQAGSVFGAAEQNVFRPEHDFDEMALTYLNKTQARCPGEFAVVADRNFDLSGVRVDSYEVACVADELSASASVLFFSQGGTFTILTHESPMDRMDETMAIKERIFSYLSGEREIASR